MTIITKIPGVIFTDATLPKLCRDSIINTGSLFCFDFLDTYCNPLASGNVANGAIFKNLVIGAPDGIANSTGGSIMTTSPNGLVFNGVFGASVDLGATYDRSGDNHSFLALAWFKTDPAVNAAYPGVLGLCTNTSSGNQYSIDSGPAPGNITPIATANGVGMSGSANPTLKTQVAVMWTPGAVSYFVNGALVISQAGPATATAPPTGTHESIGVSANGMAAFSPFKGNIYRAYKEDLSISAAATGKTITAQALAQVIADYAANVGRFS